MCMNKQPTLLLYNTAPHIVKKNTAVQVERTPLFKLNEIAGKKAMRALRPHGFRQVYQNAGCSIAGMTFRISQVMGLSL